MRTRVGIGSLVALVTMSAGAAAQPAPQPGAPAPGAPGAPGAAPPVAPGAPGAAPPVAPGAPAPGAGASAGGGFDFGGGFSGGADASATPPATEDPAGDETDWRKWSLTHQNTLSGSTGLLRTSNAGSSEEGTFRVQFLGSFFSGSEWLCNGECPPPPGQSSGSKDDVSRVGANLTISATLFPFMEAYLGFHSQATSNDQGRPELLQVLGDTDLGVKFFMPREDDQIFSFGGEAQLWLLNGTGGVGLDGSGTSFALRALASADFHNQKREADRVPLKAHFNLGYTFDNSGKLIEDTESSRGGTPITRIERAGLGISRTDKLQLGLGVEGVFEVAQPFVEWTIDLPVNRQGYTCNRNTLFPGDSCLGDDAGFKTSPSRIGVGSRFTPWLEGLSLTVAAEIGTGATSSFLEEVAPELPWNIYFGAGYNYDTVEADPTTKTVEVEKVVEIAPPPELYVLGTVVNKKTQTPIPNARIKYEGRDMTGMISKANGTFETRNLEPGTYTFMVSADEYRDGTCTATVVPAPVPAPPGMAPAQPGFGPAPAQPGFGPAPTGPTSLLDGRYGAVAQFGQPPAGAPGQPPPQPGFGAPPAQPGMAPAPAPAAQAGAPIITRVQCELEALPQVGNVVGGILDAASGTPISAAKVTITDKLNRELELAADAGGAFRFENVPPGLVKITIVKEGYLKSVTEIEVKAREDARVTVRLNKRPKRGKVLVTGRELKLREKVHFSHNSSTIEPDSMALIQEVADVLERTPKIKSVEIQGHTDNTGSAPYNARLSQERADAVRRALIQLGISSARLSAKGYGQEKPLVANVSKRNRARNRRVQIMITKK